MVLIGHRGVGKSSLLQRLQIYLHLLHVRDTPVFDLDREIEKSLGTKVDDLFKLSGEKAFREIELQRFHELSSHADYIIAVGAGFELDKALIPSGVEIVWVRRPTDSLGRIFLDRPRLNAQLPPLQEFHERIDSRNRLYGSFCTRVYELPEGLSSASDPEKIFFFPDNSEPYLNGSLNGGGIWTAQKGAAQCPVDVDYLEIREDLVQAQDISLIPEAPEKLILSFRKKQTNLLFLQRAMDLATEGSLIDWPLELGDFPQELGKYLNSENFILSVHDRLGSETLADCLQRLTTKSSILPKKPRYLKAAPMVESMEELQLGLDWQQQDPDVRNFLPRSKNGRWRWIRLWLRSHQYLNFIGSGLGDVQDQPTVFQWLATPEHIPGFSHFAAVLGDPVFHSYTPIEHYAYFKTYQAAVYSITLSEAEWSLGVRLLRNLGLKWAAVTSPLKTLAGQLAGEESPLNTLFYSGQNWRGTNTDEKGFRALADTVADVGSVAVWGGGGTLQALKSSLPGARFFSARSGQERESSGLPFAPDTVVWAAPPLAEPPGGSNDAEALRSIVPCARWRPQIVLDLNYRDDSRAKEYCQRVGARYISGLLMFRIQAQAQRAFWESVHGRK
jgi:shikimate kinase/shikimate 5-dehydrogenase